VHACACARVAVGEGGWGSEMGEHAVKQQTSLGGYVCGSAGMIGSTQGVRR